MSTIDRIYASVTANPGKKAWEIAKNLRGVNTQMVKGVMDLVKNADEYASRKSDSSIGKELAGLVVKVKGMEEQIIALAEKKAEKIIEIKSAPVFRCGVISCTHFGSIYEEIGITKAIYDWFQSEGIKDVFHCGDLTEGANMRKGHEHEIHKHGADAQAKWTIKQYPYIPGITTHLIAGNHDAVHMRNGGVDVCAMVARSREDINYVGPDYARFIVNQPGGENLKIDMIHPDGGCSYALSYKPQKIIEQLEHGTSPDLLLIGHFHKAFTLPEYKGVSAVLAGCTQRQTGFMRRNGLAAHVGGHIIEIRTINGQKILSTTFRSFYPSRANETEM